MVRFGRNNPWNHWLDRDSVAIPALLVAGATYYLVPTVVLSSIALAVLAYLIWMRSHIAVVLIPIAVPFYSLPKHLHFVRQLDFSLGETVITLCTVLVLVQQLLSASRRPAATSLLRHFVPYSVFEKPAIAFLVAAILATIAAHFHTVAFRQFRLVLLDPLLFYWLVLQRAFDLRGAARLAIVAVSAGVLVSLFGLGELLFRPQALVVAAFAPGTPHLVNSVYKDENSLALLLDRALPMALALTLLPGWIGEAFRGTGPAPASEDLAHDTATLPTRNAVVALSQSILLVGVLLMGYILYRTESRGGELAFACCAAMLGLYWQRRRPLVLVTAAAALAALLVVERHRLWDRITTAHGLSTDARLSVWQSGLRMIHDHLPFGVGPDNFLYYYSNDSRCAAGHVASYYYRQKNSAGQSVNYERCLSHPHNLFLDLWLSTGVLGLLAGVSLLVLFGVLGVRAFRNADHGWQGPLLGALLAMLALVIHGEVDNSYFLPDLAVYFWLCLAIVGAWYRGRDQTGTALRRASLPYIHSGTQ